MWSFLGGFMLLQISCSFVYGHPKVPCLYIFGDSLFDAGNNNDLNTKAKANYAPYGIDFPGGVATGRYTNGITTADALAKILGFQDFIPPFNNASGEIILKGVNYASGSAGLLAESASHLGDRIWLSRQVKNHGTTIEELKCLINNETVSNYLNKCLYLVNMGSNDYINNYFMQEKYNSSKNFTPRQYSSLLIAEYETQLQALYNFGARRTAVFGLGMIGCVPAERLMHNETHSCVHKQNNVVKHFNDKLRNVIDSWNANRTGARFTFVDLEALQGSSQFMPGMKQADPCCKLRTSDYQCEASIKPCRMRAIHPFYDGFHPTQLPLLQKKA